MNSKPKPSEDYAGLVESLRQDISDPNGKLMSDWDSWRKYIASGGDSSWPRDQFEGHLDAIAEIHHSAADALEAVLAERDAMKDLYAATDWVEKIKGFTSCYEYVPASAVKEDEKFQITLTGAEIRALIDARRKARGE